MCYLETECLEMSQCLRCMNNCLILYCSLGTVVCHDQCGETPCNPIYERQARKPLLQPRIQHKGGLCECGASGCLLLDG